MAIPYATSWLSKEEKQIYNQQYYQENKERLKEKALEQPQPLCKCECGLTILRKNLNRHLNSAKHDGKAYNKPLPVNSEKPKQSATNSADKKEYNKAYYQANKEDLKQRALMQDSPMIKCKCGMTLLVKNLKRHLQSKAHSR